MSKDVIVVGGGYFGCAISYFLAKNGLKTLLLEQKEIGSGASGGNFGCVQVQDCELGLSLELTLAGYKKMQALEEELESDLEYREMGSLIVAEKAEEMTYLQEHAQVKKANGLELELLDKEELQRIEPNLGHEHVIGASYSKQGHVNGFKLMNAYVKKGKHHGLELKEHAKVKRLLVEGQKSKGVELCSGEKIYAENVVLAAGAWTKELCSGIGLKVPVEYVKAEAFVTEQIKPFLNNYFSLASFFTEAHGKDEAATSLCCVQTKSGNLLIGETSKPGLVPPGESEELNSPEHCSGIYKSLKKFFPTLKDLNILRSWTTPSPFTESLLPIFGPAPVDNIILAAGFKSAVVLTPIVGEIVADLVIGRKIKYDLREFAGQAKLSIRSN